MSYLRKRDAVALIVFGVFFILFPKSPLWVPSIQRGFSSSDKMEVFTSCVYTLGLFSIFLGVVLYKFIKKVATSKSVDGCDLVHNVGQSKFGNEADSTEKMGQETDTNK